MNLFFVKSAEKELLALPKLLQQRVFRKVKLLSSNPYGQGCQKLAGGKGYRIRLGDYRVVYTIDKPKKMVVIIKIAHRREVYK